MDARARHSARRMAMQALYQWSIAGGTPRSIYRQYSQQSTRCKSATKPDLKYFSVLLRGVIKSSDVLDEKINAVSDLDIKRLDNVEMALLRIGAFELMEQPELPFRVIIDETIKIAKEFGATSSFRYVNAVMDKLSSQLRPESSSEKSSSEEPSPEDADGL